MGKKASGPVEIAPRIVANPRIRFGQPTIKGTRVPVAGVLDELAAGSDIEEIVQEYGITAEDVRAVLRYAAAVMAQEDVQVASR